MWNPPIELTAEEQKIAVRTRKTRKFFVLLREHRHEFLDADLQKTLAKRSRSGPGGHEPVEVGRLARATLLQADGHVGDRDTVELTVMDKRWPMVLDCLGAEPPPFSQGTLFNFRRRLIAHNLDKTLLERTLALAEHTGGFGARPLRAVWDATPRFGAGRVEDTLNRLGHALRQAVGRAAQALGTSVEAVVEDAGLTLVGHSRLKAALELDGGEPSARECALDWVLEEVARWQRGLAQQPLAAQHPPLKEVMDPITQMITQDTAPDPEVGPGGRRITKPVAPDRRISIADQDRRHGRKSRSKPFNGFKEHLAVDLDRQVTRAGVVRPANEPEPEAVEWRAEALESGQGLLPLDLDLGDRASPRMAQWAEQGVDMSARPWPPVGPLGTKTDFPLDVAAMRVTCPQGQTVPMVPGKNAQCPAHVCEACPVRVPCTPARLGHGRSLHLRADEPFQQKRRAKIKTRRGRASRRKRPAGEPAIAHQLVHQGRRARDKGLRQHQFDGRRHAALSTLQRATYDEEEHRLAS